VPVSEGTPNILPSGTVTLVLGDVEGSTPAWEADPKGTEVAMAELSGVVDEVVGRFGGLRPVEQGEGDSFVVAFARADDGVACALALQQALAVQPLRLRLGVHTGDALLRGDGNYAGPTIIRAARVRNLAHGGQAVVTEATRELIDALPHGASLRDLGVHQLKGLSRPERVYQLCHPDLDNMFPPLVSIGAPRHNLPPERTTFIGREHELAELAALLDVEHVVTVTGSGGCGKTRLALQVAALALECFPDGAWFADLSTVTDPGAVPAQVAQAFGLKEGPGMAPTEALTAYLERRRALVVVDNCEHVLDASALLVDALAGRCPDVVVLATSRQSLSVEGEVAWRVPSLPVPPDAATTGLAEVSGSAAAQLFADRARRARSGFALSEDNAAAVADICRRLDGIPLAIELAAARVPLLTPAQIAGMLDERFALLAGAARTALPRQQTLEGSVDWSHDLLTDVEQAVFHRVAVFAGSFSLAAARHVCAGPGLEPHQVLDVLSQLVDKSLVVVDVSGEEARYRLLETVRAYAARRLAGAGEEPATRESHRDFYLSFVDDAAPPLEGRDQSEWAAAIAVEYPNVRAALATSLERAKIEALASAACSLVGFWTLRGPVREGEGWLDRVLAEPSLTGIARARALFARAALAAYDWDAATVVQRAEEGLPLARQARDARLEGRLLLALGSVNALIGGPTSELEESIAKAREVGDGWALAGGLMWLGSRYMFEDPHKAKPFLEESIQVAAGSDPAREGLARATLGGLLVLQGDLVEGERALTDALSLCEAAGDAYVAAASLGYSALLQFFRDDADATSLIADRIETVAGEGGMHLWDFWVPFYRAAASLSKDHPVEALGFISVALSLAFIPVTRAPALYLRVEIDLALARTADARADLDELDRTCAQAGFHYYDAVVLLLEGELALAAGDFGSARSNADAALASAHVLYNKTQAVDALEFLAALSLHEGRADEAARLFGAARAIRDTTGYARSPCRRDLDLASVRETMTTVEFDIAFDEGRRLSLEAAVSYAHSERTDRTRPTS
jgi:predicted ATPase/class 3 adenylate cyclase